MIIIGIAEQSPAEQINYEVHMEMNKKPKEGQRVGKGLKYTQHEVDDQIPCRTRRKTHSHNSNSGPIPRSPAEAHLIIIAGVPRWAELWFQRETNGLISRSNQRRRQETEGPVMIDKAGKCEQIILEWDEMVGTVSQRFGMAECESG
jgi:hypothetical protein